MKAEVPEKLVAYVWQHQLISGELTTDEGHRLQVIYPGRHGSGSGPDFRDAVIDIDGMAASGDIEIHVKSSCWKAHGHHRDPEYNKLILHVTMQRDGHLPIQLQKGTIVPTLCLSTFLSSPLNELCQQANATSRIQPPCPELKHQNEQDLSKIIDSAGRKRFAAKVAYFQEAIQHREGPGQTFFRGIMRALGYAKNSTPCDELASRLPLAILEGLNPEDCITSQALLLGTAGLLPSQQLKPQSQPVEEMKVTEELEKIWQLSGITETMRAAQWRFAGVRPVNHPSRRLIGLSYLLTRYQKPGLLQGILELVHESPPKASHRWLEDNLVTTTRGYWKNRFDFGIAQTSNTALIGRGKAAEIIINAVLPFAAAYGEISGELQLKKKAIEIYRHYPEPGDNELTRHMKLLLLLDRGHKATACQQQGLIHIFNSYCRSRDCGQCPIALNRS